jgi:hypothetical protein
MIEQSSQYLMEEIIKDFTVIADRGLHQPALDYLLPHHHEQVDRRFEEDFRRSSYGLTGRNALIKYLGKFTPEEELIKLPRTR